MRRPLISAGPLVGLVVCIGLLSLVSLPASSQLTAYSETRSFRDALEGRSMEEAISGPVDKDTSSYGDRTGSTSGGPTASGGESPSSSAESGAGGDYGAAGQQDSNAGQMMVNIPANGNLNPQMATKQKPMQPVEDQQQEQQPNGSELEREAGPISPDFPVDTQQQMMEQQQMLMKAKQMMMMGRSGRLTGAGAMPNSMLMDMLRTMKEENTRKKMSMKRRMMMGARSGRLQQEQQQTEESPAGQENKYEAGPMNGGSAMMSPASNSYGKKMGAPAANGGGGYETNNNNNNAMQDTQQMMTAANGQDQYKEKEKGYEGEQEEMAGRLQQVAKMAAMKSMRAKYASMMNGNANANGNGGMYKKQAGNMGQSMMMSLANKAAYMASQKSQQQMGSPQARQAPAGMMMMPQNGAGSSYSSGNGAPSMNYGSNGGASTGTMGMSAMQRSNGYQSMGSGTMRAMRRANQRKAEKKISPAMMNAMLNKMLAGGRQPEGQQMAQAGYGSSSGEAPKSMQMAVASMLMNQPAPMRAEMLAKMMMMSSGSGGAESASMKYSGNNNKRELYKQMMMSAMQQQQPQMDEQTNSDQDEQQQVMSPMSSSGGSGNYGDRSSAMRPMAMAANAYGSTNGAKPSYGQDSPMTTTPSSYAGGASTMGPSTMSYGGAMNPTQQQSAMDTSDGYDGQKSNEMADTKGMSQQQQQQQEQPMMKSYGNEMSSPASGSGPMMVSMRMVPKMSRSYQTDMMPTMAANGKGGMAQAMQMMRMKQMAMNGGQPKKSSYGAAEQQMDMAGEMGGDKAPAMNGLHQAYQAPEAGKMQQQQQQEQADGNEYGGQQQQQQPAYGTKSASEASTPMPDSGVKGSGSSGSMNRPMSMGMSYGQDQQRSTGDDGEQQQQQQTGDEDQYGAAPMGQAEPFAFDYKVEDEATGNNQYRKEESDKNGVVRGSYGYMDSNSGVYRHVEYVADENGFRAQIKSNEPGLSDKTTQQQAGDRAGQSPTSGEDGTKSSSSPSPASSEGAYQSPQAQSPAPPSSSSSLGGSAALQQDPTSQLQMTTPNMDDQMQQRQMPVAAPMGKKSPQDQQQQQKQMSAYQGQQQQQQTSGAELEK